ncbi:hypothetical protein JB92DRAFT_2838204 [Gautieria morchelliformis]|nr:hypothetical protein JB92DRAFT_2838204 [Gautieria morchelliformis]
MPPLSRALTKASHSRCSASHIHATLLNPHVPVSAGRGHPHLGAAGNASRVGPPPGGRGYLKERVKPHRPFGQLRPQVSSETIVQPDIARLGRHIGDNTFLSPDVVVKGKRLKIQKALSAKDLPKLKNRSFHDSRLGPKLKNLTRLGWDMDPFVVVSFGKKVFRTRVIRHSLNPTGMRNFGSTFAGMSRISRETVDSFLTRHGKPIDGELSFDEVVMCLEQELVHPRSEKKRISDDNAPHFDSTRCDGRFISDLRHASISVSSSEAEDSSGKSDDVVEHPGTAQMVHQSHYEGVKWRVPAGSENSVKIIVQNRMTGQLEEEKMQVYVRLGIRLLYKGATSRMEGHRGIHVAHG